MPLAGIWLLALFAVLILIAAWAVRRWSARDQERARREIDEPPRSLRSPPELLPPPSREPDKTRDRWR
jgi:hypothetical protein